jgi:formylglycine-generating enzyme required for sulfatase activity/uncharacterized caspase-like protein
MAKPTIAAIRATALAAAAIAIGLMISIAAMAAGSRGVTVKLKASEAAGAPVSETVPLYERMIAVVVGIDRYANLAPDENLSYAVRDAKGVADVLRQHYPFDEIITLYDEQATREGIMKVLGGLQNTGPEDGVMIYFALHGITRSTPRGDIGYLIPYDGSLKRDEMYKNISMQQIKTDVSPLITAKHVLFVADACFGGLLLDTRSTKAEPAHQASYLREITREPVRQIITAGGKDQSVLDGGPRGHSVFTGRFIEALEGVEDFVTARELGLKVQREVYADAAARGHQQRPLVGEIYGTGDFVFFPDAGKRQALIEEEVRRLEAEISEIERRIEMATARKNATRQRALERDRLSQEAALKLARLRKTTAQREAELRDQTEQKAARNRVEQQKLGTEREERLAHLRQKAEKLRRDVKGGFPPLSLDDGVAEMAKITAAINAIDEALRNEWMPRLDPLTDKLAKVGIVEPRDQMFETVEDYEARKRRTVASEEVLLTELSSKIGEVIAQMRGESLRQHRPLEEQRQRIVAEDFPVAANLLALSLRNYILKREELEFSISYGKLLFSTKIAVPRKQAKFFWKTPNLLVPVLTLGINKTGRIVSRNLGFLGPEGEAFVTDEELEGELRVGATFRDCGGAMVVSAGTNLPPGASFCGPQIVVVPAGSFDMGDNDGDNNENPVRRVTIQRPFAVGVYEVTQAEWRSVMGTNSSKFKDERYPVEKVSWNDAKDFVKRLSAKTGKEYRLLSESEWEYVARAGSRTKYPWGSHIVRSKARYGSKDGTLPVGSYRTNAFGLYDTVGNVREWTEDCWNGNYNGAPSDGKEWTAGDCRFRVLRGGSWFDAPWTVRSSNRAWGGFGEQRGGFGFRIARTVSR